MTTRSALVTGASRGIGAAIATALAREGYALTLTARRASGLEAILGRLSSFSGSGGHGAIAGDLAVEDDVRRVVTYHRARFEHLDLLVLNAGMADVGSLSDYPVRRLDKQYLINVRASFLLVQSALPMLRAAARLDAGRAARVIAISSITAVASEPTFAAYASTKAALTSLCESINIEEHDRRVSATSISPGYVDTDLTAPAREVVDQASMILPEDIAEVVLAITRLSARAVVPDIVMSRRGPRIWRA